MVKAKICGITNQDDAMKATYAGAWALGFVFYKKSPRFISPSRARKIIDELPPFVTPVGVFVNQNEGAVKQICRFTGITTLQFHGYEEPSYFKRLHDYKLIKAFQVDDMFNFEVVTKYKVDAYLFDTYQENTFGGTGKTFNWNLLKDKKFDKPVILSGGLTPDNVQEALGAFTPYAVDVSSGVEKSPGIKDHQLVKSFLHSAANLTG